MSKRNIILITIISIIALFMGMLSAIVLGKIINPKINTVKDLPTIAEEPIREEKATTKNILIVGTDKSGELSDVIIVCRYNPDKEIISLFSIPRDTRVQYKDDFVKINSLYAHGIDILKRKVETITSLRIDNYLIFSTTTFKEVIDILGGVDFEVPQNMKYNDPYQNLHINLKKGYQHLDGNQAEQLVRFRKYKMGDIDRIKVQQDFLKALIEQKLTPSIIVKAPSLAKEILSTIQTDLSFASLKPYFKNLENISNIQIKNMTLPGDAEYINKTSFWIQNQEETRKQVQDFLSDTIIVQDIEINSDISSKNESDALTPVR